MMQGQMVLNANTRVTDIPDRSKRMYCFEVICGKTKKTFEIAADDQKSKHEWILAINKAVGLARILSGERVKNVSDRHSNQVIMRNFHLIKFGSSQSMIPKLEGGVKLIVHDSQNDWSADEDEEGLLSPTNLTRSKSSELLSRPDNQSSSDFCPRGSKSVQGKPRSMRVKKELLTGVSPPPKDSFGVHDEERGNRMKQDDIASSIQGSDDGTEGALSFTCRSSEDELQLELSEERMKRQETDNTVMVLKQSLAEGEQRIREATIRAENAIERSEEANQRADIAITQAEEAEQRANEVEARAIEAERRVQESERQKEQAMRERNDTRKRNDQLCQHIQQQQQENLQLQQRASIASMLESHWIINDDEITLTEEELGRGAWAYVKVAMFRGTRVAAKCFHNIIVSDYNNHLFCREVNMAACVHHPNLVQFIGASLNGVPILLTELMATSLRALLEKKTKSMDESKDYQIQPTSISLDVARALNYLHLMQPHPMIHRDISSANVLLNPLPRNLWKAKVSDYGTVNLLEHQLTKMPGALAYAAPEAQNPENQSPKMDIFSFGVLLLEMVTARLPDIHTREEDLAMIKHSSLDVHTLIQKCLSKDRKCRPSAQDIISELTTN